MATFLKDTFTDTDGVLLTSHTMDTGSGWTLQAGTGASNVILSNQAKSTDGGPAILTADAGSGNSDVTVALDLIFGSSSASGDQNWVVVHLTDSSNFWMAGLQFSGTFDIYENKAGAFTNRASVSFTPSVNTTYTCQVVLSVNSITATINGGNQISYASMSFNQTAHLYGWRPKSGSGASIIADNFLVSTAAVSVVSGWESNDLPAQRRKLRTLTQDELNVQFTAPALPPYFDSVDAPHIPPPLVIPY